MLDVFFSVDVEVWCDGWHDLDEKFPNAFQQYVYGQTSKGDFGLAYQSKLLAAHGLTGVFFVEPLFALRFGIEPLAEIVELLKADKQEIQLHLHTEWADEARSPVFEHISDKRQHLRYFDVDEQTHLIREAQALLEAAGAEPVNAFRAGSFAFNRGTLQALAANGIQYDSSYNATLFGRDSGVFPGISLVSPTLCDGVVLYPMTVFKDGFGRLRHAQLTACSYGEMEGLLWRALEEGRKSFVLLSHNFEMLNRAKNAPDRTVVKRFEKICQFLDRNRDCFSVRGFHGLEPQLVVEQPKPLLATRWQTAGRLYEQMLRRVLP